MSDPRLELSIADGVARITFANARRRNAIDLAFVEAFAEATQTCAVDPSVRVVVIAAQGEMFSVGGDLADFLAHEDHVEAHIRRIATLFHVAISCLHRAPSPVVLALNGTAAGGGFSIVLGADLVVAKRSARLVSAYTKSGLTPDGGATYFLERVVGYRKAFEIMALNPVIDAQTALSLGLVSEVVDDDRFDEAVEAIVKRLLAIPSDALVRLKQQMRLGASSSLVEQLDRELDDISAQAAKPSTLDALRGFLGKPKPAA